MSCTLSAHLPLSLPEPGHTMLPPTPPVAQHHPAGALGSLQGESKDSPRGVSDGSRESLKGTLLGVGFR